MEIKRLSENCIEIMIDDPSHTLGNLINKELQQNDVFAGYKCPHPLENKIVFKIISDNPKKSIIQAISRLIFKLEQLNNF